VRHGGRERDAPMRSGHACRGDSEKGPISALILSHAYDAPTGIFA
jgi:hypothetical protein